MAQFDSSFDEIEGTTNDRFTLKVTDDQKFLEITVRDNDRDESSDNTNKQKTFSNKFSQLQLKNMDLNQPLNMISKMINIAKKGTDQTLKCFVGYSKKGSNIKKDKNNSKLIDKTQFTDKYKKGDSLFVIISINQQWYKVMFLQLIIFILYYLQAKL